MKYNSMKNTSNNNRAAEFKYLLYQRRIKQNKIKNFINFTFKKYDIKILNPPIALPFQTKPNSIYLTKNNMLNFHQKIFQNSRIGTTRRNNETIISIQNDRGRIRREESA